MSEDNLRYLSKGPRWPPNISCKKTPERLLDVLTPQSVGVGPREFQHEQFPFKKIA